MNYSKTQMTYFIYSKTNSKVTTRKKELSQGLFFV